MTWTLLPQGHLLDRVCLNFPRSQGFCPRNLAAGTMEYVKSLLRMYEHSIPEFYEDKLFLSMRWVLLAKAKGRKSCSELCYKNTPWGCTEEKKIVSDGAVKGRSWQWSRTLGPQSTTQQKCGYPAAGMSWLRWRQVGHSSPLWNSQSTTVIKIYLSDAQILSSTWTAATARSQKIPLKTFDGFIIHNIKGAIDKENLQLKYWCDTGAND